MSLPALKIGAETQWGTARRGLHAGFLTTAEAHPTRIALRHGGTTWTYNELRSRAYTVANAVPREPFSNRVVLVLGHKSPGSVAAILGALCAGCAYSTISPASPRHRLEAVLELLRPALLVTTGLSAALLRKLDHLAAPVPAVLDLGGDLPCDVLPQVPRLQPGHDAEPLEASGSAAYILFTSGSSGRPKGVCMPHEAASMAIKMYLRAHPLRDTDRVGNQVELGFDLSMFDMFTTFSAGAELCLLPDSASEPEGFFEALAEWQVTSVFTVPSVAEQAMLHSEPLPDRLRLRRLLFSGEPLSAAMVERLPQFLPRDAVVWNLYGGTEMPYVLAGRVTVDAPEARNSFSHLGEHVSVAVEPLASSLEGEEPESPSEDGLGELVVRGPALFAGYIAEGSRLPQDPVESYGTGDLVRREPDGSYTVLGRRDRQVKIDGVRVELDSIEQVLEAHPLVVEAAVIRSADGLEVQAFVVPRDTRHPGLEDELDRFCEGRLLPIECPSEFVFLDCLPRTASGKKDRRALMTVGTYK